MYALPLIPPLGVQPLLLLAPPSLIPLPLHPAFVQPGEYSYHYVVDGQVVLNPEEEVEVDTERGAVHKAWSYLPDTFRVYYCTGWEYTVLHYRRVPKEGGQKGNKVRDCPV